MGFSTILWVSVALWALNGWFQGFGAPSGRRLAHRLVQQPRARALLRHLEHGPFHGRRAHVLRRRAVRRLARLARRVLGAGTHLHPRRPRDLRADAGPAAVTLGLPKVADWKNDHLAQLAPPGDARPDAAALDPAHPGDLGARALERDHVRHALRDRELGHPLPAGGARLRPRRREPLHGDRHDRRHRRLPALRLTSRTRCFAARRPPANLLFAVAELRRARS